MLDNWGLVKLSIRLTCCCANDGDKNIFASDKRLLMFVDHVDDTGGNMLVAGVLGTASMPGLSRPTTDIIFAPHKHSRTYHLRSIAHRT